MTREKTQEELEEEEEEEDSEDTDAGSSPSSAILPIPGMNSKRSSRWVKDAVVSFVIVMGVVDVNGSVIVTAVIKGNVTVVIFVALLGVVIDFDVIFLLMRTYLLRLFVLFLLLLSLWTCFTLSL